VAVTASAPSRIAATEAVGLSRARRITVWAIIVTASVIGLASILTTWTNRQMLSNSSWKAASTRVIQDPRIRSALSVYVVNTIYDRVNLERELQQRLPPNLKGIAGPLSGALRQPAVNGVDRLLQRPRIQQLWIAATVVAHQKLVNVLENKTGAGISTGNGVVTVDLSRLITQVAAQLGLPPSAIAKLPSDAGVITVMRSDQLAAAQNGVRAIRVLSLWLTVLVLGMFALAVYLARGIRRRTLRNIGWALVLIGLVVLFARRLLINYALDALTTPGNHDAGRSLLLIETTVLGDIGRAVILYGIIVALGAILAGPTRLATSVRARLAPVFRNQAGIAWSVAGFGYLLLVLWGGTHALRQWWGILLLGLLLAAGIAALRRETLKEFQPTT
jgi:hypothetical protein